MCTLTTKRAITRCTQPLAAAIVALTVLAACGGDSGDPDSSGTGGNSSNDDTGSSASDSDGDSGDDGDGNDELSPLEEYLGEGAISFSGGGIGIGFGGPGEPYEPTEAELQQQRDLEEHVVACMADEGFEYVPDVIDPDEISDPTTEAYALPPDEFAEQYGYGASTLMFEDADYDDPNEEHRESLSEQARKAYDAALHGEAALGEIRLNDDGADQLTELDLGCYGQASEAIYGAVETGEDQGDPYESFDSLMDDLFQLAERVGQDPQVVEATQAWQACMADAGHADFENVGDPEQDVFERMDALYGWDEIAEGELEDRDRDEDATVLSDEPSPSDAIDPEELKDLQEYELAVAKADYECRDEHYNEVANDVRIKLEQEFVDQHRTELEELRDAIAESPGLMGGAAGG